MSNFLDFLGGINLSDIAGVAGVADQLNRLSRIGEAGAAAASNIAQQARQDTQFQPFTVTTGFGEIGTTPEGGYSTAMSPQQQARQEALSGITGGLLGQYTLGVWVIGQI